MHIQQLTTPAKVVLHSMLHHRLHIKHCELESGHSKPCKQNLFVVCQAQSVQASKGTSKHR